jgi:thiosulfate dehydrogenase (quinone) large subunit
LFTRLSSLGAIGFLLMFYFATPPFVGYFYSLPSEGSYLLVNKNLVELGALVVVFLTGSGKVYGIDRIVHGLVGRRLRRAPAATA